MRLFIPFIIGATFVVSGCPSGRPMSATDAAGLDRIPASEPGSTEVPEPIQDVPDRLVPIEDLGRDAALFETQEVTVVDVTGATPDLAAPIDGGSDVAVDQGASADVIVVTDRGPPRDGQSTRCGPSEEMMPRSGACDSLGHQACQMWSQRLVDGGYAFARCVASPEGCARADRCRDFISSASCSCGAGPACPFGEVCLGDGPDATPSCHCVVPP